MRILQVIPFFSPKMGGSAQVAYQTARHLGQRGHQVTVVASNFGSQEAAFPSGPFQVVLIPNLVAAAGFYFSPQLYSWLKNHLTEFDLLHLHEVRTFQNIVAHSLAARYKIPYVISAHGTLPVIVQRQTAKRIFDRLFGQRILAGAKKLVAVSPFEADQYRQAGIAANRITVIYNGLDLDEFADLPPRGSFQRRFPELNQPIKMILFLGRLHQIKGVHHLIEACARLHAVSTVLVIAGPDEGQLSSLQTLTHQLRLEGQVRFMGPLYERDKLAAYVDADVLAHPASYEIFGLVPFEALLCGTPVIVSESSGAGQLVAEAEAGYLVPYADTTRLAETLHRALTSPQVNRRLVANGQRYIHEHLDWHKITGQIEELYAACLQPVKNA